jgi:endonuclease/exonuclease/phosphatase family metal-dependent hydrolase
MPFYNDLRPDADFESRDFARVFPSLPPDQRVRAIEGIVRLKDQLAAEVPQRMTERNLLLASWNIRELGFRKQRLPESYFYMAEIMAAFDIVAVQEVKGSLKDLRIVLRILGPDWDYLVTDITGGSAGNSEMFAYLFNTRRVRLSGQVGELVLWSELTEATVPTLLQLKRTPFLTGFVAGWKTFSLLSVHLHPGDERQDVAERGAEIALLLRALETKQGEDWAESLVILGDMNLYWRRDDANVARFAAAGYREASGLAGKPTTASAGAAYDRMFFRADGKLALAKDGDSDKGGVFNPFQSVFRPDDQAIYADHIARIYGGDRDISDPDVLAKYYRQDYRTGQMSDHLPIWTELVIDDSRAFLERKKDALNGR